MIVFTALVMWQLPHMSHICVILISGRIWLVTRAHYCAIGWWDVQIQTSWSHPPDPPPRYDQDELITVYGGSKIGEQRRETLWFFFTMKRYKIKLKPWCCSMKIQRFIVWTMTVDLVDTCFIFDPALIYEFSAVRHIFARIPCAPWLPQKGTIFRGSKTQVQRAPCQKRSVIPANLVGRFQWSLIGSGL